MIADIDRWKRTDEDVHPAFDIGLIGDSGSVRRQIGVASILEQDDGIGAG